MFAVFERIINVLHLCGTSALVPEVEFVNYVDRVCMVCVCCVDVTRTII